MRIISIDPGELTGFCYAELDTEATQLKFHPFQIVDDVDDLYHRLAQFQPKFIIIEDFEFRGGARKGLNLFPVQLIGIARLYGETVGLNFDDSCRVFIQKASTGKSYYTDSVLKQLGLHKRGLPHGMDSTRHLLQWCTFGFGNQFVGKKPTEEFAVMMEEMDWWKND